MPAETPDLGALLRRAMKKARSTVNVCLPARILSYDPVRQTVQVKPTVSARYRDPDTDILTPVPIPPISNVPVAFPSASGFSITWPLTPGDPCTLVFADRSTDEWRSTGNAENVPADVRRHDLTDAICIPGGRPFPQALTADSYTAAGLVIKGADIRLGSSAASQGVALGPLVYVELQRIAAAILALGGAYTPGAGAFSPVGTNTITAAKVKAE